MAQTAATVIENRSAIVGSHLRNAIKVGAAFHSSRVSNNDEVAKSEIGACDYRSGFQNPEIVLRFLFSFPFILHFVVSLVRV